MNDEERDKMHLSELRMRARSLWDYMHRHEVAGHFKHEDLLVFEAMFSLQPTPAKE